jgi:hypothetical protein
MNTHKYTHCIQPKLYKNQFSIILNDKKDWSMNVYMRGKQDIEERTQVPTWIFIMKDLYPIQFYIIVLGFHKL